MRRILTATALSLFFGLITWACVELFHLLHTHGLPILAIAWGTVEPYGVHVLGQRYVYGIAAGLFVGILWLFADTSKRREGERDIESTFLVDNAIGTALPPISESRAFELWKPMD